MDGKSISLLVQIKLKERSTFLWQRAPHDGPRILRPSPQFNGVEFSKGGGIDEATRQWMEKYKPL